MDDGQLDKKSYLEVCCHFRQPQQSKLNQTKITKICHS